MAETLRPITVIPHYMRLHEWIALESGFFEAEGLEPVLRQDFMLDALLDDDPQHGRGELIDYAQGAACTSSACEWGVIRNAGAGHGKVLKNLYSVAPYAIFARPDSAIESLSDLRGRPVGVMLRSGTHFTTLKALEAVMPRDQVAIVPTGGAGHRIDMLLDRQIDAACLLDPERAIAEQMGLRCLAHGGFRVIFYVSHDMAPGLIAPYIKVLKRADQVLRVAAPETYAPLWEKNMRPETRRKFDCTRFGRGELLFFELYAQSVFDDAMAYAKSWGLTGDVMEEDYRRLTV